MTAALPLTAMVKRELVSTLRRPRSFVFAVACVLAVMVFVLSTWPEGDKNLSHVASTSIFLLEGVFWLLKAVCCVLIPGLAAASIVSEKESESLDLLRVTLISPSAIVIGKLINVVGFMLLLAVAVLPVLGTALFLVGVDWAELLFAFLSLISLATHCAAIGLMCSAVCRKTSVAVAASYLALALASIATSILVLSLRLGSGPGPAWLSSAGFPHGAIGMAAEGIVTACCLAVAIVAVRQTPSGDEHETRKPVDKPAALAQRRRSFPFYLVDPLRRKKLIEDNRNPVFVRELRWGQRGGPKILIRTFYMAFLFFLVVDLSAAGSTLAESRSPEAVVIVLLVHTVLAIFVGTAALAGSLTREHENRTLEMVRTTLLSPREMVMGKLYAGIAAVCPVVAASLMTCLPFVLFVAPGWAWGFVLIQGYITFGVCVLLSLSVGLLSSVLANRTTSATALSFGLAFLVFIGFTIALTVLNEALRMRLPEAVLAFASPLLMYATSLEGGSKGWRGTLYWLANVTTFSVLGFGCIAFAVHRFARRFGREE